MDDGVSLAISDFITARQGIALLWIGRDQCPPIGYNYLLIMSFPIPVALPSWDRHMPLGAALLAIW